MNMLRQGDVMGRWVTVAVLAAAGCGMLAQAPAGRPAFDAFEVATVKPVQADLKAVSYTHLWRVPWVGFWRWWWMGRLDGWCRLRLIR